MAWADDFTWVDKSTRLGPTALNKLNRAIREAKDRTFDVAAFGTLGTADDSSVIQAAFTAAAAVAGTVTFPYGQTLTINSYLTIAGNNVRIVGNGCTLKLGSGFISGAQGQGHIFANGQSDIVIDGLRFDGNGSVLAPDANNNFAVWLTNCPRVTIANCYITAINAGGANANGAFLWTGSSSYGKALDNDFVNCEGGAIFFQRDHCVANGNTLNGLNDVGIVFNGQNCSSGVATGNTINSIPAQAAFGVEAGAYNCTITGNTISGCFSALDLNDAGYAGSVLGGCVFADNVVTDLDKGASAQNNTFGVVVRAAKLRDVKIVNNFFSGLTVYGTTDSFVIVTAASEGLTIRGNTFEGKAQAVPAAILFSGANAHTRPVIEGNVIRSTSSVTKLARGVWLGTGSTYTGAVISRNRFENISAYGVQWDTSTFDGRVEDNEANGGADVLVLYQTSPWGTLAGVRLPHLLGVTGGGITRLSRMAQGSIPASGTWQRGDIVWQSDFTAAATPGWVCTTAGSPGTWKAMAAVAA